MARKASHAGSWYTENARELGNELDSYLQAAGLSKQSNARAVIAPHAGYRYSGRCAAFAFANIDPGTVFQMKYSTPNRCLSFWEGASRSRVFILGPSHHHFTRKCALSRASIYKTPLGDLPVDLEIYEELKATGKFEDMDMNVDEAEHSMEMHLPYIAKVFQGSAVKVIPILVGALTYESEVAYGKILAKYIDSPSNFFSVSSDFCHWGSRFNYTYYEKRHGPIYKSIEALDQNGMNIIESGDPGAFRDYLQEYDNTICGQHPIAVFLNMLKHCATKLQIKFLQYEQSSRCKHMRDSSVSYASAVATVASA